MVRLSETVAPSRGFQTSVNIELDLGRPGRVSTIVATAQVRRQVEGLLRDVVSPSTRRAKLLVGAYGRGKSHIALTALTAMWEKGTGALDGLVEAYESAGSPFAETLALLVNEGPRVLPVVVPGGSSDLRRSLMRGLRASLDRAGLGHLMPRTSHAAAAATVERWAEDYPETLSRMEVALGVRAEEFLSLMAAYDTTAYEAFVEAYPSLTSGGSFDPVESADPLDVVDHVLSGLSADGISGMYIVYDEFGKYLEANIGRAGMEDVRLLQDLAERCNRSEQDRQLHLLLICHKGISNYIDSTLPRDRADGWRGVSGRFLEVEVSGDDDQAYELMAAAVVKDPAAVEGWLSEGTRREDLARAALRMVESGLVLPESEALLAEGCFPLHPVTAYLLPRISSRVAQNERTLFTFLCADEDRALSRALDSLPGLVPPDVVYDYFEPLLRKEYHATQAHRSYALARAVLVGLDPEGLPARFVKAVALIEASGQGAALPPTPEMLGACYRECGWGEGDVAEALSALTGPRGGAYLRRSDGTLRLKEASGVDIEREVADRAEKVRLRRSLEEVLARRTAGRALYPSRYNEDHEMVRYFDVSFAPAEALAPGQLVASGDGDGRVVCVLPSGPDGLVRAFDAARALTAADPLCVAAVPRAWSDPSVAAFALEAASALRDEADSEALAEEYDLVCEDCRQSVDAFVASYLRPELSGARYFANGVEVTGVSRRSHLSHLLSDLCEAAFPNAPRITSEALNRNSLTGAALHARSKVLRALLRRDLEPNLGFTGNAQELAMARSALGSTGVVEGLETSPRICLEPADVGVRGALDAIGEFLDQADATPLSELYTDLCSPKRGIGMKRGPVPVMLAAALRGRGDSIKFARNGEERELTVELFDDMAASPGDYTATALGWEPWKSEYVAAVAALFGVQGSPTRARAAEAARCWFVSLPQASRNAVEVPGRIGTAEAARHASLVGALRRVDSDSDELLLSLIPAALGAQPGPEALCALGEAKAYAEGIVGEILGWAAAEATRLFDPGAGEGASLCQSAKAWLEALPAATRSHAFTGRAAAVISMAGSSAGNDAALAAQLARAVTSLRPADWAQRTFGAYTVALTEAVSEVAGYRPAGESSRAGEVSISFTGEQGEVVRTFGQVECSKRANLLRNDILACLDEVGRSLTPEERRQVVFDVLRGLC